MPVVSILSPLPGTFYRSAAPGQPVFKNVGDTVSPGDIVGIVEVMKQFNEVPADVAGTITKFHVENEGVLDVGMPLVDIDTP